ncbi:MAG TPA: short chain dehydrogenase [Blastocatellia bacterium]|jgi:NAD(P)-dependent dehydrogenase (short-subunit alcohol dehydrogenase family)|nr:short chain dehydrogenase [Blastocatellia bacterium]
MKVIVIGATGIIGAAVAGALDAKHEVVRASRRGAVKVDIDDPGSIGELFESVQDVDAVVCCAASAKLAPLDSLSDDEVVISLKGKLLGQVSLARRAIKRLRDGGSITLTSGVIPPIPGSAIGALVNAGLEGFVRAAAIEMPRGLRINVVSPGWVKETLIKLGMDSAGGTAANDVARAYLEAVEGTMQGRTIAPNTP